MIFSSYGNFKVKSMIISILIKIMKEFFISIIVGIVIGSIGLSFYICDLFYQFLYSFFNS